jgi:hypothetical protein
MLLCLLREAHATSPPTDAPERVTLEQRVKSADFIFVGVGRRIFFVDRGYNEVPVEKAANRYTLKAVVVEIEVLRSLYPAEWREGTTIRIPMMTSTEVQSSGTSQYMDLKSRYIGNEGIYFTRRTTIYDEVAPDNRGVPTRLKEPIRAHALSTLPGRTGPRENPLPMKYLDQVVASIKQRLSR